MSCSKFLFEPLHRFLLIFDIVLIIVLDLIQVGNDELERFSWSGNRLEDLLIIVDAESAHEKYDGDGSGPRAANLHHQHAIFALLHCQWLTDTILLRENFGNLSLASISLVHFYSDPIGGQIFHGNEGAFGSVDDEITTRVIGIFAPTLQKSLIVFHVLFALFWRQIPVGIDVSRIEIAASTANHNRHAANLDLLFDDGLRKVITMDGEIKVHRRHVSQFSQTAFEWERGMLGPIGLTDGGWPKLHVLHANLDVMVQNVEFDNTSIFVFNRLIGADTNVSNDAFKTAAL